VGSRTKIKVVKNKTAAPFREAEFDIMYGEGISREGDLLDLGADKGMVEKSGAWYSYKGERIGQGRENAKQFLRDNKDIAAKLETELRRELGLKSLAPEPPVLTPEQKQAATAAHGKAPAAKR
jgi:recombination protein RecA